MRLLLGVLLCLLVGVAPAKDAQLVRPLAHTGMCDASAAVAISSNLFVVANDEDNTLRIYRADQPGSPVRQFNLNAFLQVSRPNLEADLEGAARIHDRIFWISSHGQNKKGKARANRHRFFATDLTWSAGQPVLTPFGQPCRRLLEALEGDARFEPFHLESAAMLAPKAPEALDIEGLAATPDGRLLIGFRNPIPDGKALLIPLLNPSAVLEGAAAQFGAPLQLDLHGLGIRDMALHDGSYTIIAGPYDGGPHFRLYDWAGPGSEPKRLHVPSLNEYHPEALIFYPGRTAEFQVLSDDGTQMIDGCPCKDLQDSNRQSFRSFWVKLPQKPY